MNLFEQNNTHIIFLAMFWSGGGPYTIPQLIYVYDFINRSIPSRTEMESSLNILLAMGLIIKDDNKFSISKKHLSDFKSFREKAHEEKFKAVIMYFNKLPSPSKISEAVKITEKQYESYIKEYRKSFKNILLTE